ncbi:MAG TPA: DoxX family protein [Rhizobiaceae bacterium]|nr:DoxX family protein [Rhizobiaceae bacterium]
MTDTYRTDSAPPQNRLLATIARINETIRALTPVDLVQFVARLGLAVPYYKSGILKWEGFLDLAPVATLLFENEFKLHLPGGPYDFPFPSLFAFLAGVGEVVLPVLLVLGLFTRFAALGLLGMTIVIQLVIPGGWPLHLAWAAMALAVVAYGPGRVSVDNFLPFLGRR